MDPKLRELWSIPHYGECRIYIINRSCSFWADPRLAGFRRAGLGFRDKGLGFRRLGFRGLGFRGSGFRDKGYKGSGSDRDSGAEDGDAADILSRPRTHLASRGNVGASF